MSHTGIDKSPVGSVLISSAVKTCTEIKGKQLWLSVKSFKVFLCHPTWNGNFLPYSGAFHRFGKVQSQIYKFKTVLTIVSKWMISKWMKAFVMIIVMYVSVVSKVERWGRLKGCVCNEWFGKKNPRSLTFKQGDKI